MYADPIRKDSSIVEEVGRVSSSWGWVLAAGVAYVIIGLIALSLPISSTLGLLFAMGTLFVMAGIAFGIHAIQLRKEEGTGWRALQTVMALAAGVLMLRYPEAGILGMAMVMVFFFFSSAAAKFVIASQLRPRRGSGLMFFSAVCSVVLGIYMIMTYPISAFWVPGMILGLDLIVHGASLVGLSRELQKISRDRKLRLAS